MKGNKYNIKIYKWNFRKHKWKIKGNKYKIKGNKLKYTEMNGRNQNPFTRNWIQETIIKYNTKLHIQIFIYIHHCQQYFLYIFLMVIFINKTNTEGTLRFFQWNWLQELYIEYVLSITIFYCHVGGEQKIKGCGC